MLETIKKSIVFFVLFTLIQLIPLLKNFTDNFRPNVYRGVGFPTTFLLQNEVYTNNFFVNFSLYTITYYTIYCFRTKQNIFKLLLNIFTINRLKKFLKLLTYSIIIFTLTQFLPYIIHFENNFEHCIGFPNKVYYVYNAQCYYDTFFEPLLLIVNFIVITIFTFSFYFLIKIFKTLFKKLKTQKNQ